MKSWRERTIEAEERGYFNGEDWSLWGNLTTCPAAEVVMGGYGVEILHGAYAPGGWGAVWTIGTDEFSAAMLSDNFSAAHQALDAIADKALEIKRGLSNG